MEYVDENIAGSLRELKLKEKAVKNAKIAESIRLPQMAIGGAVMANNEMVRNLNEDGEKSQDKVGQTSLAEKLRSARNLDRKSFDSAKKAMPAPLKIGVTAAEMMGIDVLKVLKIIAIVGIVIQILFWVIIILAAGYAFTHTSELLWEWFKSFFGGVADTVKEVVVPNSPS